MGEGRLMITQTPEQVVSRWLEAYNAHGIEAAAALYDEAATNTQWPWARVIHGREAIQSTFERTFTAFPDIQVTTEQLIVSGESAVLEWVFSGTMRGPFAGHPPTGRRFEMHGCEVFLVRGGRISEQRGYWDKATMFEQLGLRDDGL